MRVDDVRVFTRSGAGGNHLGIVDAVLDDDAMQAVATAVGYSETIFLDPEEPEPAVRIFTPSVELPFAGHPLVGVTWWLARRGARPGVLHTASGPVAVSATDDGAEVTAALGQRVTATDPPPGVLGAVATSVVEMPMPYVVCEVESPQAVAALVADPGWEHLYVLARTGPRARARFFAGGLGVPEDPATGSAAVAWAATRVVGGEPRGRVTIDQGEEAGHPSRLRLDWTPASATIGGEVVADPPLDIER